MNRVALASARYADAVRFYRDLLGFREVSAWDRPGARGCVLDLGDGLRLELLDAARERRPLTLPPPGDRCHLVVEVQDLEAVRARLPSPAPPATATSWGPRLLVVRDPDGVAVTFLERAMP